MCSKLLCIFTLISLSLSLKINIVDEDFIEVLVGNPPVPMKLLIDPVAPFSYMLKKFESSTLLPFDAYKFSNSFGTFEGKWKSDFFYLTADKIFPLRIKFLMVEQTTSVLDVDGVIGLGYSEKIDDDCSVFEQLHKMTDVFKIDNLMSYDKNKKLLTIGELPKSDNYNPVKFPLFEGDSKYPPLLSTSQKFGSSTEKTEEIGISTRLLF